MAKKTDIAIDIKGKFVVAYDTICDGAQCMMTEDDKGKSIPCLFDSHDEAFKELFDGALSMLESRSASELKEYNEGVTKAKVKEMRKVYETGDVKAMEKFLNENDNCNDNNEWVESAETFVMNRKTFFTEKGIVITGTKLS